MAQPTTEFGHKSLESMRNAVYSKIRRKPTDPLEGLSSSYVDEYIAKWDAFFVDAARWNLPGFKQRKIVQHFTGNSVKTAFAAADATFDLNDNTNASSSGGRLKIVGDLIDYEGKDSPTSGESITVSTATGALTPDVGHVAGERVEFLVPVPSDFGKPGEIWIGNVNTEPSGKLYHKDMRSGARPSSGHYYYDDGYLFLPDNLSSGQLLLHYWKKSMKVVDGDDIQTPERWDDIVLLGAAAECKIVEGMEDEASKLFKMAGLPNIIDPTSEQNGLLQFAIGRDAEQTNSEDEIFVPELGPLHL